MRHAVNGTVLNAVQEGQGRPALVFLHYFGGSSRAWAHVMERLAPDHHCIALDLRGFGGSDAPNADFTLADAVEDVSEFVRALKVETYVLIGHSMGGKIAYALAARSPPGLKALVLVAPSPPTPEPMGEAQRDELLRSHGDRAAAIKTIVAITFRQLPAPLFETCIDDNLASSRSGWSWWLERGSREDISTAVALQIPALVIASLQDPAIPKGILDVKLMPRLARADMTLIAGAGHLLPLEAGEEVSAAIGNFAGLFQ